MSVIDVREKPREFVDSDRAAVLAELQKARAVRNGAPHLSVSDIVRRLDKTPNPPGLVEVRRAIEWLRQAGLVRELPTNPDQPPRFIAVRERPSLGRSPK